MLCGNLIELDRVAQMMYYDGKKEQQNKNQNRFAATAATAVAMSVSRSANMIIDCGI